MLLVVFVAASRLAAGKHHGGCTDTTPWDNNSGKVALSTPSFARTVQSVRALSGASGPVSTLPSAIAACAARVAPVRAQAAVLPLLALRLRTSLAKGSTKSVPWDELSRLRGTS